jgi:hypothetical protein
MNLLDRYDSESLNKARKLVAEGGTLLIAIDSNAFFKGTGQNRQVDFNQNWMGKFRGLANKGEELLMSCIWDTEVKRHFSKSIDSQVDFKLPKFIKTDENKQEITELNRRAKALKEEAQGLVENEWDTVKTSFNTKLIDIPTNPTLARKIIELWASSTWPFEKNNNKRHEFQDAFALLSLLDYVESTRAQPEHTDTSILVITGDSGCIEFCAETECLIPCSDIDKALALLAQRDEIVCRAARSIEISAELNKSVNPLVCLLENSLPELLAQENSKAIHFPIATDNERKYGWLKDFTLESVLLLPTGPRGALFDVVESQPNMTLIAGGIRFSLTVTLTAMPYYYNKNGGLVIAENHKCDVEVDFSASYSDGKWMLEFFELPGEYHSKTI